MTNLKLGIIGAGKMAGALVRGWVSSGLVSGSQVGRVIMMMMMMMIMIVIAGDVQCA